MNEPFVYLSPFSRRLALTADKKPVRRPVIALNAKRIPSLLVTVRAVFDFLIIVVVVVVVVVVRCGGLTLISIKRIKV